MNIKIIFTGLAGGLLTLATAVYGQQPTGNSVPLVTAPDPTASVEDSGADAFKLQGSAIEVSRDVTRQNAVLAPYEISGTGIGGARGSTQTILTAPLPERGAPFRTEGGVFIYPSIAVGYGYNDNVLNSGINKLGSGLINVAPQVMAEMKRRGDRYTAMLAVSRTDYSNSSNDNYSHYEAWVAGDNYFSARARAGWAFGQINTTDPRGSNLRATSALPDRWHAPTLRGTFIYGAPEASGRIEVDVDARNKRYNNNPASTTIAEFNERSLAGRFFYRLGSRSLALVEASERVFDYTSAASPSDNTDRRLYLGYTWDASAATTGIVKIGRMSKRFTLASHEQFSGGTWTATVRWLPLTYSKVEFSLVKVAEDPNGFGSYLLNTNNSASWKHQWSTSFSTTAAASLNKTKYGGTSRSDDIQGISLGINYNLRRWLTADSSLKCKSAWPRAKNWS